MIFIMMFFLLCFFIVTFIGSRCWFNDQIRRRFKAKSPQKTDAEKYEDFEEIVIQMIEATTNSRDEIKERMDQFYRDFPPPSPRHKDMRRMLRG